MGVPRSRRPMHVFGVRHITGRGQVPKLIKHLSKTRAKRIGLEGVGQMPHRFKPDHRFWKAVELRLARKGIQSVHLEKDPVNRNLLELQQLLGERERSYRSGPDGDDEYRGKTLEEICRRTSRNKIVLMMAQKIDRYLGYLNWENSTNLSDAVSIERSFQLRQTARKEKLSHIAIGISHASDLSTFKLQGIKITPIVNERNGKVQNRMRKYRKLRPLMKKLVTLAGLKLK